MKTKLIQNNSSACKDTLLMFFCGWSMDEHPFLPLLQTAGTDVLLCYDYQLLDADLSILHQYKQLKLVAWSMGVWAAAQCLATHCDLYFTTRIAVNGTLKPIDDALGIPTAIYQGTLAGLNEKNLQKFWLRMCGSLPAYKDFLSHAPTRKLEDVTNELAAIEKWVSRMPLASFTYDKAIIGAHDNIFSASNQQQAWQLQGVPFEVIDIAHFDAPLFAELLQ